MDFKIELPTAIPATQRAELRREFETIAQVIDRPAEMKEAVATGVLFILAATIQALGVIYNWIQVVRVKNPRADVVIKKPDGTEIHLNGVTLDDLKLFME
jgi:hypothetical protein